MANLVVLDQKSPEAAIIGGFDFSSLLATGQTISSATAVASVWAGVDANPSAILSGLPTVSGLVVSQKLTGGVAGVIYKLRVSAVASDGSTQVLVGYLAVVEDPL